MRCRPIVRTRRQARCWHLSVALALPVLPAWGATFVPGATEPDPPTGAVAPVEVPQPAPAGPGIQWTFGPWRHAGSLSLDGRWLRDGDGLRSRQGLIVGDVEFASYLWQPWFLQLRAGVGMVVARGQSGRGDDAGGTHGSESLNGRLTLSLFPASRFPFELRAELTDSRSSGDVLGAEFRSQRLALSQSYSPPTGNLHLRLDASLSQIDADDGRSDRLGLLQAGLSNQLGVHGVDLDVTVSRHELGSADAVSTQSLLSLRHDFTPSPRLSVDTLASWNRAGRRVRDAIAGADFDTDVKQLSTVANWRSGESGGRSPLLVGASVRWLQAASGFGLARSGVQTFNASLGASQDLADVWRASGSGSVNLVQAEGAEAARSLAIGGSLAWVPTGRDWAGWRYTPTAQSAVTLTDATHAGRRQSLGLQGSHGLTRDFDLAGDHRLALNLTQSLGTLIQSGESSASTDLAHSVSVYWQHSNDSGSQRYAALSLSDARSIGGDGGQFQLANLQLNQRTRLSRMAGWSANLTVQASRSTTTQIDPFTGDVRLSEPTWQMFYSGSVSADVQRVFGVPRLRYALLLGATSQRLERRDAGDIDAPLEHVSASMEHRLDYSIGRLEARLSARMARIEGRTIGSLFARVQRRF